MTNCGHIFQDSRIGTFFFFPINPFTIRPRPFAWRIWFVFSRIRHTAQHRTKMPAKFADALAMGAPMLGTQTPPLMSAANDGLIEVLGDQPLHEKIDEIFRNYARHKERALGNRARFCEQYSYAANRSRLMDVIEGLDGAPPAVPREFSRLITVFHDELREVSAMTDSVV